ncbi:MAG: SDR family NAD(P)-dependent oxidoreductase [Candidatus Coatesbacteria bacterium]|nr:SDR family NAD(P)-dependent oxidoreductase [Candidatus Coatesbacteria bacterium]
MTERRVLITGTSTGIGEAAARLLAERGWRVYAGVRREADAESWRAAGLAGLSPLFCDVTDQEQIRAAVATIAAEGGGLDALVNNAGVSAAGPLEYLEPAELCRVLEVNVVGQQALTRACLPLLRRNRGRIVFIGSVSGRTAMPLVGAYCMSKYALEALADAWRVELRPWEVGVILLEPGPIATPIWDKVAAERTRRLSELDSEALERYGPLMEAVFRRVVEGARRATEPPAVARVIERALTRRRPRARYVVGRGARGSVLTGRLPDRLRDWLICRVLGHDAPPRGTSANGT